MLQPLVKVNCKDFRGKAVRSTVVEMYKERMSYVEKGDRMANICPVTDIHSSVRGSCRVVCRPSSFYVAERYFSCCGAKIFVYRINLVKNLVEGGRMGRIRSLREGRPTSEETYDRQCTICVTLRHIVAAIVAVGK